MTIETIKEILGWLDQHSWYIISIFIPIGLFCIFYSSKQTEKANKELIENYIEWKKSSSLTFEEWGKENNRKVDSGVISIYYQE